MEIRRSLVAFVVLGTLAIGGCQHQEIIINGPSEIPQATTSGTPAPTCKYQVQTAWSIPAVGANYGFSVNTDPDCKWTAVSNTSWIELVENQNGKIVVVLKISGTGNGSFTFKVQPNTEPVRVGTLTVAGFTVTVGQAGK